MSKENYKEKNTKNQYHHLNRDQRAQIEILVNEKDENGKRIYSNTDIAAKLGVHRTTIWRELKYRIKSKIMIKSGKIKNKPYNVDDAQYDADYKRAFSKAVYIVEQYPKLAEFIDEKIKIDKWAPDVIAGYIESHKLYLQDGFTSISTTTIYRAIHYHLLKSTKKDTTKEKSASSTSSINKCSMCNKILKEDNYIKADKGKTLICKGCFNKLF